MLRPPVQRVEGNSLGLQNFGAGPLAQSLVLPFWHLFRFRCVERKESVPLPCSFLAWLERSILGGALHEHFVCFAGSVLLCCNSSLRFGDSQHVDWSSLVVDDQVLRGVSWRTKTSRSGCPFGCLCAGFYGGRDLSRTWVGHYLTCLNSVWKRVRAFAPDSTPDCLFFSFSSNSFAPLSYAATLKSLRALLTTWGGCKDSSVYTLRSMKSTFLSWMAQVGVPEDLRAKQGHHRQSSAQLYSRDDVFPQLRAQSLWWQAFSKGFRPLVPQHRGGGSARFRNPASLRTRVLMLHAAHCLICLLASQTQLLSVQTLWFPPQQEVQLRLRMGILARSLVMPLCPLRVWLIVMWTTP